MRISDFDSYYQRGFRTPINIHQRIAKMLAGREQSMAQVADSLFVLNQLARHRQESSWKDDIYQLKGMFLQIACANGYLKPVELCQQEIKCHTCHKGVHTSYYPDGNIAHQDTCWHCNGTGVYKRVLLYVFMVKVGDREYVWHQPADRVRWAVDLPTEYLDPSGVIAVDLETLPKFREPKAETPKLSNWQIQRHLLRLAVFVNRNQLFRDRVELFGLRNAISSDLDEIKHRIGQRIERQFRVRELLERVGLVESELPF